MVTLLPTFLARTLDKMKEAGKRVTRVTKGHLWTPAEPQSPNDTGPPEILCVQKDPVRTRTDPTEDFFLE
jgi:hypothetical protein